jgi:hypothetical protein
MEKKKVCGYCGHVRCDTCLPDRWPNLADGCCVCRGRVLSRLTTGNAIQVKEMPRLYGPGLAVD